ncbi:MAG: hypothetical protein M3179_07545 [Actinomycetota bacterium]|nr:hypothetical protein [Actinomycetota bacterium]
MAAPATVLVAAVVMAAPAQGHETKAAGPLEITVGWEREPAYTGVENFVEVAVAETGAGPVADVGTGLTAAVSYGPASKVLALVPAERPGVVRAALVPTRPGSYTIHVTGSVRGQVIDVTSTCSETSFDCVTDSGEIQFPAPDPPSGQLAERLERELARGRQARSDAAGARRLALVALAVGAVAVGTGSVALVRATRARRRPPRG